jgi:preprotein translocase subunit SecB
MTMTADPSAPNAAPLPKIGVEILRHYLQDMSFENPRGPALGETLANAAITPETTLGHRYLGQEDLYQVVIHVTVPAKVGERTLFLLEMTYAAEVRLHNIPQPVAQEVLSVQVPQSIFPMVQQILVQATTAGGYPNVVLHDVDFRQTYLNALAAGQIKQGPVGVPVYEKL